MQEQAFRFLFVAFSFLRCKLENATLRGEHAAIYSNGGIINYSFCNMQGRPLGAWAPTVPVHWERLERGIIPHAHNNISW
jgi:hypothetical protein